MRKLLEEVKPTLGEAFDEKRWDKATRKFDDRVPDELPDALKKAAKPVIIKMLKDVERESGVKLTDPDEAFERFWQSMHGKIRDAWNIGPSNSYWLNSFYFFDHDQ